jgi:hypothetical protein
MHSAMWASTLSVESSRYSPPQMGAQPHVKSSGSVHGMVKIVTLRPRSAEGCAFLPVIFKRRQGKAGIKAWMATARWLGEEGSLRAEARVLAGRGRVLVG